MITRTYLRTSEIVNKWKESYHKNKHIAWNKGKQLSSGYKIKISEGTKRAMLDPIIREKISVARSGKLLSESHKKAIGIGVKGKQAGEKHYNWKGGLKAWLWQDSLYKSVEYGDWRTKVFKRDNFTCKECNVKGKRLHAHHIAPKSLYPDLVFSLDNGITLCEECHKKTSTYGINRKYITKLKCQPL